MQLHHSSGNGRFIHKARGQREPHNSIFWAGKRKKFLLANIASVLSLSIIVLLTMFNFYGSTYYLNRNTHHFKILSLDYDGGVVGQALMSAYDQFKGNDFPAIVQGNPANYDINRLAHEVCKNKHIWGLIYTHPGASDRLSTALAEGNAAATYNSSDAITYIWNGARYTTLAEGIVDGNLQLLVSVTNTAYDVINGTYAYSHVNTSSPAAVQTLAQPFSPLSSIDIQPTEQGARVLYNNVTIVITIITEFFYVMAINGIAQSFECFTRLGLTRNLRIRWISSILYSATLAACLTGVIWSFRGSWHVSAAQGVETWLVLAWACHINFLIFDTITGWIGTPWIAFFVLTWVLLNVTSSIVPLELTPGIYHWEYALPGFETYQLLVTVWSRGCVPQLDIALPVLFVWWILGFGGSWLSMIEKCNKATKIEESVDRLRCDLGMRKAEEGTGGDGTSADAMRPDTVLRRARTEDERFRDAEKAFEDLVNSSPPMWLNVRAPFQDRLGLRRAATTPARHPVAAPANPETEIPSGEEV